MRHVKKLGRILCGLTLLGGAVYFMVGVMVDSNLLVAEGGWNARAWGSVLLRTGVMALLLIGGYLLTLYESGGEADEIEESQN